MMNPIIPVRRKDPFDDDGWLFELKLDGFRGLADTIQGRMLSKNGNAMGRFEQSAALAWRGLSPSAFSIIMARKQSSGKSSTAIIRRKLAGLSCLSGDTARGTHRRGFLTRRHCIRLISCAPHRAAGAAPRA